MTATGQPVLMTADLNRLLAFDAGLLGAIQTSWVPGEGPAFDAGLRAQAGADAHCPAFQVNG
jgi:hypothetical protein